MRFAALVLLSAILAGCADKDYVSPFKEDQKLAGKLVPASTLNAGRVAYLQYCRSCHGDNGDGKGPAAPGMRPPPRNFTQGSFKFAGVLDQKLPRDEDLIRVVRQGLHGTAMLGWDVPEQKLDSIVQYLKTLSPKWKDDDAVGEPVPVPADPWAGSAATAVERGKRLYHGYAQCVNCHPAYESRQEMYDDAKTLSGTGMTEFREAQWQPEIKESEYGNKLLPPDFLYNEVRSINPGTERQDLYRILVAGVTGAAMPAWNPVAMPDGPKDIWALAYYVDHLIALKGTPAARQLRDRMLLAERTPFTPPPEPPAGK